VIGGEHQGGRYPLHGDALTLGRGTDNDLVLPDIALSRKHLRLMSTQSGWSFRDLGSGNGTRLNGRSCDEGELQDGDQLEVGNSVLEYLSSDRPPGKAHSRVAGPAKALIPAPDDDGAPVEGRRTRAADVRVYRRPSKVRVALWAALAASVVLAAAVGAASWLTFQDPGGSSGRAAGLAHYRRGAAAFKRAEWEAALWQYQKAAAADPTLADADRAVREIRAYRDMYQRGLELQAAGRAPAARTLLSNIPPGAAFHANAQAALRAKEGVAGPTAGPRSKKPRRARKAAGAKNKADAPSPHTPEEGPVDRAMALYRAGGFEEAGRLLHGAASQGDAKAGKMAGDMRAFVIAREAGADELRRKRTGAAIRHLERALRLDEGLGQGYRSTVSRQLAEALAQRSREHLASGRLTEAAKTAVRARTLIPDHKPSQAVLDKLLTEARRLLVDAHRLRNPDPQAAIAQLKTALRITPRKSPEHVRAQELLTKIEDSL